MFILKSIVLLLLLLCINLSTYSKPPVLNTKQISNSPKKVIRICCAFGSDVKMAYIPFLKKTDVTAPSLIGNHRYMGGGNEKNGIIYTRHGGFLDIAHVRDYIDWTAYFYAVIMDSYQKGLSQKTIYLEKEGGKREVTLCIPSQLNEIDVYHWAGRMAYDVSLWHEIATWFGFSYIPLLVPEKFSSFSPEDLYSNLTGVHIGMKALKSELPFEEAATKLLLEVLFELGAVETSKETFVAMEKTAGDWWNNKKALPFNSLTLKRLYDQECITPWLVHTYVPAKARSICKPNIEYKSFYEFKMELHTRFPKKHLFLTDSNYITHYDFPKIIRYIEETEKAKMVKKQKKFNSF